MKKILLIVCFLLVFVQTAKGQSCGQGYEYVHIVVMTLEEFWDLGPEDLIDHIKGGVVRMDVVFTNVSREYVMYDVHCDGSVHNVKLLKPLF